LIQFDPTGKVDEGSFKFQRYVRLATRTLFGVEFSSKFSCSLCTVRACTIFSRQFCFSLDVLSGLRSLELTSSGQQCLQVIRDWASVPRIVFFGPAVPSNYSRLGFGPSNCLLRASCAFKLFEPGLWSLELSSLGQQCLQVIRDWASVPRIVFFGPAVPSNYLSLGFSPSNHLFRASSASALFEFGPRSLESLFRAINTQNARVLVAIYQFGSRMSNTKVSPRFATPDGPVFVSSALCREIFHTYGMKFAPMDASDASQ
jgi:hypothetical protein